MKSLKSYIQEKLIIKKRNNKKYNYFPETKQELQTIIKQRIKQEGPEVDLNDIDTFEITDMPNLFANMHKFNGNISTWDVSNVTNMYDMFSSCKSFNQDISNWNVSNVDMYRDMFKDCPIEEKYKPKFS